jgi:DNA-binding NarL/FixJ family response regulator
VGGHIDSKLNVMIFDNGFDQGIRCRYICDWFTVDSCVSNKEGILSEIERLNPDVVVMDLDLYARIDGVETSRQIRNRFKVPVMYDLPGSKFLP